MKAPPTPLLWVTCSTPRQEISSGTVEGAARADAGGMLPRAAFTLPDNAQAGPAAPARSAAEETKTRGQVDCLRSRCKGQAQCPPSRSPTATEVLLPLIRREVATLMS